MLRKVRSDGQTVDTHAMIMSAIRDPLTIGQTRLDIEAKVGVAVARHDGKDAVTLLRNAEAAMYAAKSEKRAEVRFFDSRLSEAVGERLAIEGAMRESLTRPEDFYLVYQPKMDAVTESRLGPKPGPVVPPDGYHFGPNIFIPIAEETGLIIRWGGAYYTKRQCKHDLGRRATVWRSRLR